MPISDKYLILSAQYFFRHTGDGTLTYSSPHVPSRVLSQICLSGQRKNEKKNPSNKHTKLHFDCFLILQSFIPSCLSEMEAAARDEVLSPRAVLPQDCRGSPQTGASPFPWPVGHGDMHGGVAHCPCFSFPLPLCSLASSWAPLGHVGSGFGRQCDATCLTCPAFARYFHPAFRALSLQSLALLWAPTLSHTLFQGYPLAQWDVSQRWPE